MNNKPKTKLLTISLMCCGRPDTTERCLKSLMPIREAIDSELQVIDTGCSKETRQVIEKYADEVFEFQWCNDFAKARNFQLDQANGKMFLFIDDDEWFLDAKYIIDFFKDPECTKYNIGGYFQRNYLDLEAKEYSDIEVIRMCAVTPETRFIGKVHEYIEPASGNAIFMDTRAGHFGYVYTSEEENRKHSMRNIPLLQEMIDEDPDNFRWPYQIAQEYKALREFDKLYEICKNSFDRTNKDATKENENIRYRGSFICGMALALFNLQKMDELIELFENQAKNPTIMQLPLAFLAYYAAVAYFKLEKNNECKRACDYYLKSYEEISGDQVQMYIQGGLFSSDTFNSTRLNMIYCFLMTMGLEQDDYGPLIHYYRRISWNDRVVRLNRGFVSILMKKAAELGYKKEISDVLNKFFTTNGFRILLEDHIDKIAPALSETELNNIADAFKKTDGEKELRLFINIRIMENQFAEIKEWDDYRELAENLLNYADMVNEWQELHDSWLLEEDDEKPIAKETMLARGIIQFIDLSQKDVAAALKTLKNLFGTRMAMTNALGELSRLYGDIQKVLIAKAESPAKFNEMYKLEEAVLQQIAELDAAGKSEEAVATYQQLVGILQDNFGVDSLHI